MAKKKEVHIVEGYPCLVCSKCKVLKPIEIFHPRKDVTYKDGGEIRRSHCIPCEKETSTKTWMKRKKDGRHRVSGYKYSLNKEYGLSVDDFNAMHTEQKGLCAICEEPVENVFLNIKGSRVAVDHCHETGKVRGLLCNKCNCGIGKLRDNPEMLRKAIEYLERE